MQTFDQALLTHLHAGNITMEEAMKAATSPNDFKLSVAAGGASTNGIEKVMEAAKADHIAAKELAEQEAQAERALAAGSAGPGVNQLPPDQQMKPTPAFDPEELSRKIAANQAGGQPPAPTGAPVVGPPAPPAQQQQTASNQ
jgi:hypothetical protein